MSKVNSSLAVFTHLNHIVHEQLPQALLQRNVEPAAPRVVVFPPHIGMHHFVPNDDDDVKLTSRGVSQAFTVRSAGHHNGLARCGHSQSMQDRHIIRRSSLRRREPCRAALRVQGVQQSLARSVTLREPLPWPAVNKSSQRCCCHPVALLHSWRSTSSGQQKAELLSSTISAQYDHLLASIVACQPATTTTCTITTQCANCIQLMCSNLHSLVAQATDQTIADCRILDMESRKHIAFADTACIPSPGTRWPAGRLVR